MFIAYFYIIFDDTYSISQIDLKIPPNGCQIHIFLGYEKTNCDANNKYFATQQSIKNNTDYEQLRPQL